MILRVLEILGSHNHDYEDKKKMNQYCPFSSFIYHNSLIKGASDWFTGLLTTWYA